MTISRRRTDLSDDRLKAAIAYGFDATNEEAASFAQVSDSSVKRWKTDPEIKQISEAVAAFKSIYESKRLKDAVTDAVESAEERIKRLFDRSLRLSEKALQKAEAEGDEITYEKLVQIHENFTKWASKYAASEAPKRMQFEGSVQHSHVHVIGLSEARNVLETARIIDSAVGRPLIAGESNVIDVQPADA